MTDTMTQIHDLLFIRYRKAVLILIFFECLSVVYFTSLYLMYKRPVKSQDIRISLLQQHMFVPGITKDDENEINIDERNNNFFGVYDRQSDQLQRPDKNIGDTNGDQNVIDNKKDRNNNQIVVDSRKDNEGKNEADTDKTEHMVNTNEDSTAATKNENKNVFDKDSNEKVVDTREDQTTVSTNKVTIKAGSNKNQYFQKSENKLRDPESPVESPAAKATVPEAFVKETIENNVTPTDITLINMKQKRKSKKKKGNRKRRKKKHAKLTGDNGRPSALQVSDNSAPSTLDENIQGKQNEFKTIAPSAVRPAISGSRIPQGAVKERRENNMTRADLTLTITESNGESTKKKRKWTRRKKKYAKTKKGFISIRSVLANTTVKFPLTESIATSKQNTVNNKPLNPKGIVTEDSISNALKEGFQNKATDLVSVTPKPTNFEKTLKRRKTSKLDSLINAAKGFQKSEDFCAPNDNECASVQWSGMVRILRDDVNRERTKKGLFVSDRRMLYSDIYSDADEVETVKLLVIVSSSAFKRERRDAIRLTWWEECKEHKDKVKCFFLTDDINAPELIEVAPSLRKERKTYKDIEFMPIGVGIQFGYRFLYQLQWAMAYYKFDYLLRVDDDVLMCLDHLVFDLKNFRGTNMHWGFVHCETDNTVYVDEGVTMLTYDVVKRFLSQDPFRMRCHPFGDQQLAIWTHDLKLDPYQLYFHDTRIHHTPPASTGAKNYFMELDDICTRHIAVHGVYAEDMETFWQKKGSRKYQRFDRTPAEYWCSKHFVFFWDAFGTEFRYRPKYCYKKQTWKTGRVSDKDGIFAGRETNLRPGKDELWSKMHIS